MANLSYPRERNQPPGEGLLPISNAILGYVDRLVPLHIEVLYATPGIALGILSDKTGGIYMTAGQAGENPQIML